MPIYEFFCSDCQNRFERISRSSQQEADCPTCGKPSPKQVSAPSIGSASSAAAPSCPPAGCGSGGFT